jgi:hypothetical protein
VRLSPFDDYPFHQAVAPLDQPVTSDPRFNDGYWFSFYREGTYAFLGLRLHPNTNVMDGYAGAVHRGVQRNVRASRALRPRTNDLSVGPVLVEIVEPMRVQRIVAGRNDSGVSFDVLVRAAAPVTLEAPHVQLRHGVVLNHLLRYSGPVRCEGRLEIDGEELVVDRWYGARDHSWGIRSTMGPHLPIRGVEEQPPDPRAIRIWVPFEAGHLSGFFHTHEGRRGETLDFQGTLWDDGEEVPLTGVQHRFEYLPGTRRLAGGAFTLLAADGREYPFTFRVACEPAHPEGFGYARGWSDGGNPGAWRGPEHVETSRFDVTDPNTAPGGAHLPARRRLGGTEYACHLEGPEGACGMAHVEHMIYGTYEPAGFVGPNPWQLD